MLDTVTSFFLILHLSMVPESLIVSDMFVSIFYFFSFLLAGRSLKCRRCIKPWHPQRTHVGNLNVWVANSQLSHSFPFVCAPAVALFLGIPCIKKPFSSLSVHDRGQDPCLEENKQLLKTESWSPDSLLSQPGLVTLCPRKFRNENIWRWLGKS